MIDTVEQEATLEEKIDVYPNVPLQHIALAFSGGGFRAACFTLGCLSYLHRIQYKKTGKSLLESVKFITSTSGGSLTNGAYSTALYSNPSAFEFADFYAQYKAAIDGDKLLQQVFAIIEDDKQWNEKGTLTSGIVTQTISKSRNFINAFAKSYDRTLFSGKTVDCICAATTKPHLEKVAFNTTEFNNGMNFYFQVNGHRGHVDARGNGYLKFIKPEVAKHLKIADIVAASSCFPSGFEPIVYPKDFIHDKLTNVNDMIDAISYGHNNPTKATLVDRQPVAFMDGGITDNMGIHCVMIEDSERRRTHQNPFDLILSCDVTSYFNAPLKQPADKPPGWLGRRKLKSLLLPFKLAPLVFVACLALIFFGPWPELGYLFLLPALVISILVWIISHKLKKLHNGGDGVLKTVLDNGRYFLNLPLSVLITMVRARIDSSIQLVSDMFLKQIRRGQYEHLFTQPVLAHRTISCVIYEFSTAHEKRRLANLETKDKAWWPHMRTRLMPSIEVQRMVDEARTMGTTLWFDESDRSKKDQIIATGQLTLCYNLIKHISRLEVQNPAYLQDADIQSLKTALLHDWSLFQQKPRFMV